MPQQERKKITIVTLNAEIRQRIFQGLLGVKGWPPELRPSYQIAPDTALPLDMPFQRKNGVYVIDTNLVADQTAEQVALNIRSLAFSPHALFLFFTEAPDPGGTLFGELSANLREIFTQGRVRHQARYLGDFSQRLSEAQFASSPMTDAVVYYFLQRVFSQVDKNEV